MRTPPVATDITASRGAWPAPNEAGRALERCGEPRVCFRRPAHPDCTTGEGWPFPLPTAGALVKAAPAAVDMWLRSRGRLFGQPYFVSLAAVRCTAGPPPTIPRQVSSGVHDAR